MSMLERIELFENSQKQKKYAQERDEEHRKKNDRQAAIIQAKSLLNKKTNGDWTKALLLYKGSSEYRRDVALNIAALRSVNEIVA